MIALSRLENGTGQLGVRSARENALYGVFATIVPKLHSKRQLFLWSGRCVTLQSFVLAPSRMLKRRRHDASFNAGAGSNEI